MLGADNSMIGTTAFNWIPTGLTEIEFNQFVLPFLTAGRRGPKTKLSFFEIFNCILNLLYTGCQWSQIKIPVNSKGKARMHYTRIHRIFQRWVKEGCFDNIFFDSIKRLHQHRLLDVSILHGDGTTNAAKKGVIMSPIAAIRS